eukprot:CAMPEP_0178916588 /NCGR_PEP_ID=MMETSP0786-20121207/12737_1 /TAXON_ID=186022 /ORGANISM="Thalassionema frauenfeldii, Strain CCMP 1798" /LENGTH=307 /DNA_ID=CAMNT_0020589969 /DNA_START=63 /DNA_END=986 /DNA_ORIENTATION=+
MRIFANNVSAVLVCITLTRLCDAFKLASPAITTAALSSTTSLQATNGKNRRNLLADSFAALATVASCGMTKCVAFAEDSSPEITDKVYIDIKAPTDSQSRRIVIGLYGKEAPKSTKMLKQLVSTGLPSRCKPLENRLLQKEQLEANKVYNSCIDNESKGVTYEYGTVWRIIKDYRIDVGTVSGKFIAREFPNWDDSNSLPHKIGSVSVQKGNESGYGFTIQPSDNKNSPLQSANIVVGEVLDGLDTVAQLNDTPVVTSSKAVNYMALTGSDGMRAAPSRSCAYGSGNLYCNEFKPLKKLSIVATGVL